jgi:DNA repair protein RecO
MVKTRAVILQVRPYRESSYLVYLFSEVNGLIHGIAKGVRRKSSSQQFLERGLLVELAVYSKPHRDLHTLGNINVQEFFQDTRVNLVKCSIRDVAFELLISAITVSDPHPEMFEFICRFLEANEGRPEDTVYPWLLWRFYLKFCAMTGFALDVDTCVACGRKIIGEKAFLNAARGGIECQLCSKGRSTAAGISREVREFLGGTGRITQEVRNISEGEKRIVTRHLDLFCRYHFDIKNEPKALAFLESLKTQAPGPGF